MEPVILASNSFQRQEYLKLLGLPFSIMPSLENEELAESLPPEDAAREFALRKVKAVIKLLQGNSLPWIIGADTLISLEGNIYGKPKDREDARRMLAMFRGRDHEVITGMALFNCREKKIDCRSVVSTVNFSPLRDSEIEWYLDTGEWQGVAGAYRIQGLAACFITSIRGSFSSIVGLPLRELYVMLKDNGYLYGDTP